MKDVAGTPSGTESTSGTPVERAQAPHSLGPQNLDTALGKTGWNGQTVSFHHQGNGNAMYKLKVREKNFKLHLLYT